MSWKHVQYSTYDYSQKSDYGQEDDGGGDVHEHDNHDEIEGMISGYSETG